MALFNRFNFNGCDLHTFQHLGDPQSNADVIDCSRNNPTGVEDDQSFQLQPLHQGFNQNLAENYQISFQNNYMKEHSSVFKKEAQNYMEFLRTYDEKMDKKIFQIFSDGLYDLQTHLTCEDLISMTGKELSRQVKAHLISQLKNYEKLNGFLNLVCDYCPYEIAIELISIAHQVLQDFEQSEHKQNKFCPKKEVLAMALKRSRDLKNIKFLNFSEAIDSSKDQEFIQKYNRFMETYCSTVMLSITRFFQNPYFEDEGYGDHKRPLSPAFSYQCDQEEEFEQNPQKKRKFSF